jgi:NAD(P)-dependent dehydrogenase (short-subunit alcohol dehydrogenase family)
MGVKPASAALWGKAAIGAKASGGPLIAESCLLMDIASSAVKDAQPVGEKGPKMIDYSGASALVTGAASGIGRSLARALAARGASVVLADVNEAGAQEAAKEIGDRAIAIGIDLASPGSAVMLIEQAFGWRQRLDLVCSNAGIGYAKKIRNEPLGTDAQGLFEVNFFAAIRLTQAYLQALAPTGARGRLMITGSENSLSAPKATRGFGLGLYGATKHAVLIMAEWLRDECHAELDVHVLMPGSVYTPLVSRAIPDPAAAPPELGLIMPAECADFALRGIDLGLFYIPTHAHIAEDIRPRYEGILNALKELGLR